MMLQKLLELTNAQIKALPTTPVELLPAPGAGYRWKLLAATIYVDCTTAVYTNINTTYSALQIAYDDGAGFWAACPPVNDNATTPPMDVLSTFLGGSPHDALYDLPVPYVDLIGDWWTLQVNTIASAGGLANKNLALNIDNSGSGDLTGGDASQVMRVRIYYTKEFLF